jgi:hypothetical protein
MILLYFWLHAVSALQKSGDIYYFFFSLLAIDNLQNHLIFEFFFLNFFCLEKSRQKIKSLVSCTLILIVPLT